MTFIVLRGLIKHTAVACVKHFQRLKNIVIFILLSRNDFVFFRDYNIAVKKD